MAPVETLAFCHWLLGEGPDAHGTVSGGAGASPASRSSAPGVPWTDAGHGRWLRLLRVEAEDGFGQLCRIMRREAALLAERSMPLWNQVGRSDPLSNAASRAAQRLEALASAAPPNSEEARLLAALPEQLLHELVAGYVDATRPAGEAERRLTARVAELAALQKINSVVNSSLDLSQVLAHTVDVVAEVMHADVVAIFLYEDTGRLVLRATRGLNPDAVGQTSLALGEGITGWTAQYGKPVAVADSWQDKRFAYVPALMEEPYHGWLSVPIILFRAGDLTSKLVGVLDIEMQAVKEFTPEEVAFAETVAGQIAIAIENARLYGLTDDQLREKVQQLQALQRVTATLVSTLDMSEVLSTVARQAAVITNTDMAGIFELDEERQLLKIVAHHNLSPQYLRVEVKVGEGAVGLAVAEKKPIVIFDAQSDPRLRALSAAKLVAEEGYRSMFSVPLISRNHVLGGISVYTRERHEFSRDQIALLFTFANDAAIAIENARLYQETRRGLDMKSTLLREMHHRVKNNLQMMASLLNLQMRRTKSEEAAKTLALTHAQIESLRAAHDLLSQETQESFGQTTVQEIARRVAEVAIADLLPPEQRIEIDTSDANVVVASQNATFLALVLNELICNAILHGLEGRTEGHVTVVAREVDAKPEPPERSGALPPNAARGAAQLEIEVRDDGSGLPCGFSMEDSTGLGLSIVQRLVAEQLKGTFELDVRPDGGTIARVRLPAR
jgi:GAF domain-containing protein/anti-sigma regulatory factor (Ser/Thr protein kinase)